MKTILPQNSILSRANTVTVDAEKFAQLNSLTDVELRQTLGDAMARLVKTYLTHVIKNNPDFTLGQALEIIELAADDVRKFTGVELETVDEYKPTVFPVDEGGEEEDPDGGEQLDEPAENDPEGEPAGATATPPPTAGERRAMLFNSFSHKRQKQAPRR